MKRVSLYSFVPVLLLILWVTKRTTPTDSSQSDLSFARAASKIPVCGETHVGGVPNTLLKQSVVLRSGVGQFPTPTSTKNEKAQAYFEQGMGYLHGYSLVEAARSFHEALRYDSTMAMAYVGLSRVYLQLEDDEAARKAAETARALTKTATEREKTHVDLRFAQLKAVDSLKNQALLNDYRQKLNGAIKRFPQDAELWLLAGNAHERFANGRGQGSSPASIAIYEKVLQQFPNHPSAHHFLIHAYEGMTDYVKALEHGKAYARLAPNLAHALHMYAHDLMKTGDVNAAIAQMQQTDAIERNLYATDRYDARYDWHHAHNISLLSLCYQYQGRMAEAEQLAKERYFLNRAIYPIRAFNNKIGYPALLIVQNRYAEARPLAESLTGAATAGERTIGHYLLGLIDVKQGRLVEARAALTEARRELAAAKKTDKTDWLVAWLDPHPKFLAALIALHDGNDRSAGAGDAARSWRGTAGLANRPPAEREKGLTEVRKFQASAHEQFGPDPWIEAMFQLEMIAQVATDLKLTDFADESAQLLAKHDPNYPGTHYALARVAALKGDAATAQRERQLARQGWSKADGGFLAQTFPK